MDKRQKRSSRARCWCKQEDWEGYQNDAGELLRKRLLPDETENQTAISIIRSVSRVSGAASRSGQSSTGADILHRHNDIVQVTYQLELGTMTHNVEDVLPSRCPDKWPKVVVLILNWNGWADTLECLESIFEIDYKNCEILLIDNCSNDESILEIRKYAKGEAIVKSPFFEFNPQKKPTELIELHSPVGTLVTMDHENFDGKRSSNRKFVLVRTDRNTGFTGGNNVGLRLALSVMCPDYILLLNNDTVVDKSFLKELVLAGEKVRNAAFLSPKIYFYESGGRRDVIQYAGAKQNLWTCSFRNIGLLEVDQGQYDSMQKTDYAHGSCMLVRTKSISEIGLLDEDFFCYREENDWTLRGRRRGWHSLYVPTSKIWHKGGRSGGKHNSISVYYIARNDFVFMKKNASRAQYLTFLCLFMTYRLWLNSFVHLVFHRRIELFRTFINGSVEGLRWKE